jgi:25S rRNA (uracil2634-N3)-methyltransferase
MHGLPASYAVAIGQLGLKVHSLIHLSLQKNQLQYVKSLQSVDSYLYSLFRKATAFDFVAQVEQGCTLFVGEGNLSFASSIASMSNTPRHILATTFEVETDLGQVAIHHKDILKKRGAFVRHGIDALRLHITFSEHRFETIIFQFPHTGSRQPIGGRNPNFVLVRDFLKSSKAILHKNGRVVITAVDSPHYRGAFQFEEAAHAAGFATPLVYSFDPKAYLGYEHTMTHQDGSAIDEQDRCSTWVFAR